MIKKRPAAGVLPRFTTYLGPRTEAAGFTANAASSQISNRWRMAARCCLTVGFEAWVPSCSTYAATVIGSISWSSSRHSFG
jgi:hypothetical protein